MTVSWEKVAKPISQIQTHVVANRAALVAVEAASGVSPHIAIQSALNVTWNNSNGKVIDIFHHFCFAEIFLCYLYINICIYVCILILHIFADTLVSNFHFSSEFDCSLLYDY